MENSWKPIIHFLLSRPSIKEKLRCHSGSKIINNLHPFDLETAFPRSLPLTPILNSWWKVARRTRRKKTRFAENPPSRNHHWPVPLPKDWQIIPLDYPRRRRSQRFAHCAFTVRSRITRRTRTSSATNVHTRTLAKTGRLNGCFSLDSRAHTHTRISFRPFLIDATRDANTNRVKRKRKLRRDHLAHVPRHVFHARVWIRARDHALVDRLSQFLLFLRIILEREINSDERDNLFTTVFVLYIIRGREK